MPGATRTGIRRSVMIGVNPPGNYLWDAKTTGKQIRPLRRALLRRTRPAAAVHLISQRPIHSAYELHSTRFWFLPIKKGNVKAPLLGLMTPPPTERGPSRAVDDIDTLLLRREGRWTAVPGFSR
jgi:hypothetical protein